MAQVQTVARTHTLYIQRYLPRLPCYKPSITFCPCFFLRILNALGVFFLNTFKRSVTSNENANAIDDATDDAEDTVKDDAKEGG